MNNYTEEDYTLINAIENSIHRALWGEIIPSLRKIILEWNPKNSTAKIHFYHHGTVSEAIENHYSSIITEVSSDYWGKIIKVDYEIIRVDFPTPLPKKRFIIYLRKEPFKDPTD